MVLSKNLQMHHCFGLEVRPLVRHQASQLPNHILKGWQIHGKDFVESFTVIRLLLVLVISIRSHRGNLLQFRTSANLLEDRLPREERIELEFTISMKACLQCTIMGTIRFTIHNECQQAFGLKKMNFHPLKPSHLRVNISK